MVTYDEMIDYFLEVEKRFVNFCDQFNGEGQAKRNSWDCAIGEVRNVIWRGDVFEKASAVYCNISVDTPQTLLSKMKNKVATMDALVLEINIFPNNPYIPKIYLELRANLTDKLILAGGTDIFPYYDNKKDEEIFAQRIARVCDDHNQEFSKLQKNRADFFKSKLTSEKVGAHAGIYIFSLDVECIKIFKDMADVFFDAYAEIIDLHSNDAYAGRDKIYQQVLHGKWAQWIMIEDEGTLFGLREGIPAEALLGGILPPIARY